MEVSLKLQLKKGIKHSHANGISSNVENNVSNNFQVLAVLNNIRTNYSKYAKV